MLTLSYWFGKKEKKKWDISEIEARQFDKMGQKESKPDSDGSKTWTDRQDEGKWRLSNVVKRWKNILQGGRKQSKSIL